MSEVRDVYDEKRTVDVHLGIIKDLEGRGMGKIASYIRENRPDLWEMSEAINDKYEHAVFEARAGRVPWYEVGNNKTPTVILMDEWWMFWRDQIDAFKGVAQ